MSTPLNNPESNRNHCSKISSACVIWQGPDISCINLQNGDAIDTVVFKLATLLCETTENVLDVTTLDFACLVGDDPNPATLLATLQAIINKVCSIDTTPTDSVSARGGDSNIIVALPTCLYFTNDEGDTVTSLLLPDYAAYLAQVICTIISDITALQSNNNNLTKRIGTLESQVANLTNYTYSIYVTSQCASSETPGENILIEEAFSNLESTVCSLMSTVGISNMLIAAINKQCPGLNSVPQLSNPPDLMKDLSGWVEGPTNVADTIGNLWLTVCDMRTKLTTFFNTPIPDPCIIASPENLEILTIATSYATVTWEPSSLPDIEANIGYRIEVFEWTGSAPTGPSLWSATVDSATTSLNIGDPGIVVAQDYVVFIYAIYSCGESTPAKIVSELLVPTVVFNIEVSETTDTPGTRDCLESGIPVTYAVVNKTTTVTLINVISGLPVINAYAYNIDVILRYEITSCYTFTPSYEDVTFSILPGASSASVSYEAESYVNCDTAFCTTLNKDISCGVSISDMNTEFDGITITIC